VVSFAKGNRKLVYVVVEKNLPLGQLVRVAKVLHDERPGTSIRVFDDDGGLQQFKDWEVHNPNRSYPYPKQWATTHYIADIQQGTNLDTNKPEWQLRDSRGKKIVSLE
jgi:hypothetical protein